MTRPAASPLGINPRHRQRATNNNWRGGRVVTQAGYVLIRVGRGHHLADVRGYAYEHRMVAEANLGRDLLPGEEVHHRNEQDRQNNDWSNLVVCASRLEHSEFHRSERNRHRLRKHGEANPMIACDCGCGATFPKFDAARRPRRFVSGHNHGNLKRGAQRSG